MSAFSPDLGERILAVPFSVPSVEVGERFGVSGSFVRKLRNRLRATGDAAALPFPGRARIVDDQAEILLRDLVATEPDATLLELCEQLLDQAGLAVSEATMSRQMQRMGLTRKKSDSSGRTRPAGHRAKASSISPPSEALAD